MCLAIPGKVTQIDGKKATVQYPGQTRRAIIGDIVPRVGDVVMVQMGFVISILDAKDASASLSAWS